MSRCPDENTLGAYAERVLDRVTRAQVEDHLDTCSECLAILGTLVADLAEERRAGSNFRDLEGSGAAPPSDTTLDAIEHGSRVDRYTVLEMLGQGGMGTVYLAYDPELDRQVALKVLRAGSVDPERGARMAQEARTMAKLTHPNIVTVFDAGEARGRTYIAMEVVIGETLASWLHARERSLEEIVARFLLAGRALCAAHAAGVVHRDFKPENVLLDRAGRVAVTDFGIAASSDAAAQSAEATPAEDGRTTPITLTRTGELLGTPGYMSPEQYAGEKVEATSDQFSFAVALYQAVFRQTPFSGATLRARRDAVVAHELRPLPPEARRRAPPSLERALLRALARDPEERFPTMAMLLDELAALTPRSQELPRGDEGPRRRRVPMTLVGTAVATLAALLVVWRVARVPGATSLSSPPGAAASRTGTADAAAPSATDGPRAERTLVVALPSENRTGDPRFDGVAEQVIVELLGASRRLDGDDVATLYADASDLTESPTPGGAGDDSGVSAVRALAQTMCAQEGRTVVLVRSAVEREAGASDSLAFTLIATDATSGQTLGTLREGASSEAQTAAALGRLTFKLRGVLDDPPASGEEPARLSPSLDALHAWAEGNRVAHAGDRPGIVAALRHAVAADPDFAEAHAMLGRALYTIHQLPEAVTELAIASRQRANMTPRRQIEAVADSYGASGRETEMMRAVEEELAQWPKDLHAEASLVVAADNANDRPLALEFARRAAADHPNAEVAELNLVSVLLQSELLAEARTRGLDLLRRFPHVSGDAYMAVIIAQTLLGETEAAAATVDRLALIDSEYADEMRADMAAYAGNVDLAERLLHRQVDPAAARGEIDDVRTELNALAQILLQRGDRAGALAAERAAFGGSPLMRFDEASTLLGAGDEREARALVRSWADDLSPDARAYGKLLEGDLLLAHGHPKNAVAAYQAAGRIREQWVVHQKLAVAAIALRDWATAESELTTCLARSAEGAMHVGPALRRLARIREQLAYVKRQQRLGSRLP